MLVGEPGDDVDWLPVVVPWLPESVVVDLPWWPATTTLTLFEKRGDFGHVVPVELRQRSVNPHNMLSLGRLQSLMGCPMRMWNLDPFGADIEAVLTAKEPRSALPEVDRLHGVRDAMADATYKALVDRYRAAEFEQPLQRLMEAIFGGQVDHTGGRGEHGAT